MSIESLIRSRIVFEKSNAKGFNTVKCKLKNCLDYKDRGGFKFENGNIIYSCFNCSTILVHNESQFNISKPFRNLLNSFNISNEEINEELGRSFIKNKSDNSLTLIKNREDKKRYYQVKEISLPNNSYLLSEASADDPWKTIAEQYLELRGLKTDDHNYYLSSDPDYRDRLIIPFYKRGKLIYWQARSFIDGVKQRYLNPPVNSENNDKSIIIFNVDELDKYDNKILFVVEGVFDAIPINGIALLGSTITEQQMEMLMSSKRELVFVIDKDKNGFKLGNKVLDVGWKITLLSGNYKDVSEAVGSFGKLWVTKNLIENIKSGLDAKLLLSLECKNGKSGKK